MLEKVLVVRATERAVGENQSRLPAAARATAALRIVRGRWRDVSQIDCVQVLDVDTKFHGRRTEEDGQLGCAEVILTLHAKLARHLGGVLARGNTPKRLDARAKQFDEVFVGRAACSRGRWHTNAIVICPGAI